MDSSNADSDSHGIIYTVNMAQSPDSLSSNSSANLTVIHDHILPSGWYCKYNHQTGNYYFYNEQMAESQKKYHELPSQYKISASDGDVARIYKQFPNVDRCYINQLMKQYHNRENLVISALLAEGHTRSHFILDEALFYKLKSAFSTVDPEIIRRLLIRNDNKEHSTITSILSLFGLFNTTRYVYSKQPQLKLKYLKFAYPEVDEIILLDLLFNNDNNVNKVSEHLNMLGYKSEELKFKFSNISDTALVKDASAKLNRHRPDSLLIKLKPHPPLPEQEQIRKQIVEQFPDVDIMLINAALESTNYDAQLTVNLLDSMTPQTSEKYFDYSLQDKLVIEKKIRISRQVQTNSSFEDFFGDYLKIEQRQEVVEEKEDKSTWTKEDGIIVKVKSIVAKGPSLANRKGPSEEHRLTAKIKPLGPSQEVTGPDSRNRQGPSPSNRLSKTITAKGPDPNNRVGPKCTTITRIKVKEEQENDL